MGTGPNFANVSNFTINWDLANKGLWQFSMNTKDGKPNWYVDLRTFATQTFASVKPAITLTGTGFPGLDGNYYAAIDNGNFLLAEKTGAYTIYFSTSATAPVCVKSAAIAMDMTMAEELITIFPNPSLDGNFTLRVNTMQAANISVAIFNQLGHKVLVKTLNVYDAENQGIQLQTGLPSGMYILEIKSGNILKHAKIEIR